MTTFIKHRAIVADQFREVADGEPIPEGDVIVSWARWLVDAELLAARAGRLGVRVPPEVPVEDLAPHASRLAVVAIEFPTFGDGRGYSTARLLRERYGFRGELRAVGQILRDQLGYLERVGFDAFALQAGKSAEDALHGFDELTVRYQPSSDEERPLWRRVARQGPASTG